MFKIPKCPSCGSRDVKLITTLEDFEFWINDKGEIDFDILSTRQAIEEAFDTEGYMCECDSCGENWYYEEWENHD